MPRTSSLSCTYAMTVMSMVFMFPDIANAATYYFAKVLALLDIPPSKRVSVLQRLVGELRVAIHCPTGIVLVFDHAYSENNAETYVAGQLPLRWARESSRLRW